MVAEQGLIPSELFPNTEKFSHNYFKNHAGQIIYIREFEFKRFVC
jgi:hypothetical protein